MRTFELGHWPRDLSGIATKKTRLSLEGSPKRGGYGGCQAYSTHSACKGYLNSSERVALSGAAVASAPEVGPTNASSQSRTSAVSHVTAHASSPAL